MKIRPVGAELFHADGRTDAQDETNSRFSQKISKRAPKTGSLMKKKISFEFTVQRWSYKITKIKLETSTLWYVRSCSLIEGYQPFEATCHLQP